jgi:hypothetical protein
MARWRAGVDARLFVHKGQFAHTGKAALRLGEKLHATGKIQIRDWR